MYGSNYGSAGVPLSPQDARGSYAALERNAIGKLLGKSRGNVNVTQIFMAPTKASQAMNDARSGARYLN